MFKKYIPSDSLRWVGLVGAGIFSLVPLIAASATLSAVVTGENVTVVGSQNVLVSWNTDIPTGSQVIYGAVSNEPLNPGETPPLYGYSIATPPVSILTTSHSVVVGPIGDAQMNYFRPVSMVVEEYVLGKELSISAAEVSGSCAYVTEYLKKDTQNDPEEVKKLQAFLRGVEKYETVHVTGIFDDVTDEAVRRFQAKYADDVLAPWGETEPTGFVYITTKKKINEIFCSTKIALTKEEEAVIAASLQGNKSSQGIGKGVISNDGSIAWGAENSEEVATGTAIAAGTSIGSKAIVNVKGSIPAIAGGLREFFSKNQFLVLILFVLAFLGIYLYGNKGEMSKSQVKSAKAKQTSIQEYKQQLKPEVKQEFKPKKDEGFPPPLYEKE